MRTSGGRMVDVVLTKNHKLGDHGPPEFAIDVQLPCGTVISVLIPEQPPNGGWYAEYGEDFGLNFVTRGHYC